MGNVTTWFEIPSSDFSRAIEFYGTVLSTNVVVGEFMGIPHGFLNDASGNAEGAIIHNAEATPGAQGPLIYLHVNHVGEAVERVPSAGGSVLMPKTSIGKQGSIAVILDTEGNHIGLHNQGD